MKITFIGTSAGTEPMAGKRHSSFAVEYRGAVYWFDTGEACAYHGYLAGIDIMATRAIFITHRHTDHTGGLPMLVWNIRKLNNTSKDPAGRISNKHFRLILPVPHI
ncbi:MAG: MBL fold metallo-hydrolase [SAR202 cluster bacterium]|nr:MBL fold metallo-hydrolase [SAR202 cluster bacterium]